MAFEYTLNTWDFMGKGIVVGAWTISGTAVGAITTGLHQIDHMDFSNAVSDTNTCKATGGTVSLTVSDGDSGTFMIYGS